MRKWKKIVSVLAAGTVALASITACSGSDRPNSGKELYERYIQTTHDNFHMKGEVKKLTKKGQNVTPEWLASFEFDVNASTSHGTFTTYEPLEVKGSGEFYVIENGSNLLLYANNNVSDAASGESVEGLSTNGWVVSESHNLKNLDDPNQNENLIPDIEAEIFENAEFVKNNHGYLLAFTGKDVHEAMQNVARENNKDFDNEMAEYKELVDTLDENLVINLEFDKNYVLTKITFIKYQNIVEEDGTETEITIECNVQLSKHGKIDEITVPDDVVNSAVEGSINYQHLYLLTQ